jgi:hypothetical protein
MSETPSRCVRSGKTAITVQLIIWKPGKTTKTGALH